MKLARVDEIKPMKCGGWNVCIEMKSGKTTRTRIKRLVNVGTFGEIMYSPNCISTFNHSHYYIPRLLSQIKDYGVSSPRNFKVYNQISVKMFV